MRHDRSSQNGIFGGTRIVTWLVTLLVLLAVRPAFSQAIWDARRGIHMPNCPFTTAHRNALQAMDPKMVLVMSCWINDEAVVYLRNYLDDDAEIFVRCYPTTCAQGYEKGVVQYKSPSDLAYEIVQAYWFYHDTHQLELTRWIPGNEPDNEWNGDVWDPNKWAAIGTYYSQVWDQVQYWKTHYPGKPAAPIELYTPAFAGFADVGVGNYWADPNNHDYQEDGHYVRRYGLGHNPGHNWMYNSDTNSHPIGLNVTQVRSMIEKYERFTWHNYWQPGIAWEHRVHQWFPQWLRERLYGPVAYYPSRITEAGWIVDALQQWPDWDAWVTPPVAWAGYYETDIRYFLEPNVCGAGGVAIWLLDDGGQWLPMAALDANDNPRPWFNGLIRLLNGLSPSRVATITRSPATLSRSCTQGSNAASQSFTVRNSGWGTLSYSITDNVNWLSCSPTSGTSTGETDTITVNYTTSSLTPGTYNGTITITASGATNSPQTIPVTLTVTAPPQVPISNISWTHVAPGAPYGYVRITWNTPNVWSDGGIQWGTTTSYGQYTATMYGPGYSHEARTANFTPGTTYHFRVKATASGYATTYSGDYTFNVPKVPVPMDNWGVGSVTGNSAVVHWETPAVASTSRVDYGTTTSYGQSFYVATPTEQHTITLTGLSPNTTYHCKATSTATNYNPGVTPDMTFTTAGTGTLTGTVTYNDLYGYGGLMQPGGGEDLTQYQTDKPLKRIGAGATAEGHDRYSVRVVPPPDDGIPEIGPLPGATVTVAGRSAVSGTNGRYTITGIPAGTHTATCHHPARGTLSGTVTITTNGTTYKNWEYRGFAW